MQQGALASFKGRKMVLELAHILFDRAEIVADGEQIFDGGVGFLRGGSLVAPADRTGRIPALRVSIGPMLPTRHIKTVQMR